MYVQIVKGAFEFSEHFSIQVGGACFLHYATWVKSDYCTVLGFIELCAMFKGACDVKIRFEETQETFKKFDRIICLSLTCFVKLFILVRCIRIKHPKMSIVA